MKTRPDLIKFYTGIDTEAMEFLLHLVGDAAQESCRHNVQDTSTFDGHDSRGRKRKLKPEDELLLTLCKLRHNFPQDDLAMRFCVNQSTVSRIFSCWTEILEACVNEFPLWPDKISVQEEMPAAFQNLYPDTRVIIDAAEIEIDRPSNPDTQSLTWSEYKSRNTIKFLLAVTPNGHGEKCQSFRGKLAYVTIERVSTKKKWRRPTHGFLHLNLKSLVRQAHERSCKLMSFPFRFFLGRSVRPLHDEKLPNSYSPVVFPSVLKYLSSDTVKGCSSSS